MNATPVEYTRPFITIALQPETSAEVQKYRYAQTIEGQEIRLGLNNGEPLLVALDALLRYAKAYRTRFESPLSDDGVLGDYWLDAAKGIRGLLNGDGACAMEQAANNPAGYSRDSKSNGVLESVFWHAINAAGFSESDF